VVAVGKKQHPIIYMSYIGLTRSKEQISAWGEKLKNDLNKLPPDIMPQIGLNMTSGKDNSSGKVSAVATGEFDVQIATFVQAIKSLNRKTFVRIGYEFEGAWNGYEPQTYVDSFIKITSQLRKENTNAATVWCSGRGSAGFMPWEKLVKYYPGDQWGIDIFSPQEINDTRLDAFLEKANEYKKPVMIGETTPRYVGTIDGVVSWDKWFVLY
jgi:beta-mannanase